MKIKSVYKVYLSALHQGNVDTIIQTRYAWLIYIHEKSGKTNLHSRHFQLLMHILEAMEDVPVQWAVKREEARQISHHSHNEREIDFGEDRGCMCRSSYVGEMLRYGEQRLNK